MEQSALVHVPKQKRHKFDKKAKRGYLVGYSGNKDGYRVWLPERNEVVLSRDVVFKKEKTVLKSSTVHLPYPKMLNDEGNNVTEEDEENQGQSSEEENVEQKTEDENEEINQIRSLRDKNGLKKPARYDDFAMLVYDEPLSYEDAIESSQASLWLDAMNEEMEALQENKTWELVEPNKNRKLIDNRWVFKLKRKSDGSIERFKARLVVKGFLQKAGLDYEETFSPVARWDTIRAVLSIAASRKLKMSQFDVKSAFLYGELEEVIYMKQPRGFEDGTSKVCKLIKSIYGLKQAPRCWNSKFKEFLQNFGLNQSDADPCLFVEENRNVIVILYVDDGIVVAKDAIWLEHFLNALQSEFKVVIGSVEYYLGMQVERLHDGSIFIHQETYARKVLERFNMVNANPVSTPLESGLVYDQCEDEYEGCFPYREAVGSLMYLAIVSRPDLAFAMSLLSQVLDKPKAKHYSMLKRIFKYIGGTLKCGILFKTDLDKETLEAFSDADYAGDKETRRSTSGTLFKYSGGAITWSSKRQRCVSLSTTESEFIAASQAAAEVVWLLRLFKELNGSMNIPIIKIDNQSAIRLIKNPEFHSRTKHIDVRLKFVREMFERQEILVEYVSSDKQLADIFTKSLMKTSFERLRNQIGMKCYPVQC